MTLPATHWTAGSRNGQCVTPNVHIYPVPTRAGVARFLAENKDESVQLAVVGELMPPESRKSWGRAAIRSSRTVTTLCSSCTDHHE